jgi:hypothetical protein
MQDLRLASSRSLRSTPIVSIVGSALTGPRHPREHGNTAIFSSPLLRALPVVEPQRLAIISDSRAIRGPFTAGWAYAIWDQIRQRAQSFDGLCSWSTDRLNPTQGGGETQSGGLWLLWERGARSPPTACDPALTLASPSVSEAA